MLKRCALALTLLVSGYSICNDKPTSEQVNEFSKGTALVLDGLKKGTLNIETVNSNLRDPLILGIYHESQFAQLPALLIPYKERILAKAGALLSAPQINPDTVAAELIALYSVGIDMDEVKRLYTEIGNKFPLAGAVIFSSDEAENIRRRVVQPHEILVKKEMNPAAVLSSSNIPSRIGAVSLQQQSGAAKDSQVQPVRRGPLPPTPEKKNVSVSSAPVISEGAKVAPVRRGPLPKTPQQKSVNLPSEKGLMGELREKLEKRGGVRVEQVSAPKAPIASSSSVPKKAIALQSRNNGLSREELLKSIRSGGASLRKTEPIERKKTSEQELESGMSAFLKAKEDLLRAKGLAKEKTEKDSDVMAE